MDHSTTVPPSLPPTAPRGLPPTAPPPRRPTGRKTPRSSRRPALPPTLLYLDQNYLSGIAKGKPVFRGLEPALREAVLVGAIQVLESAVHERESRPRPDLGLMSLLRELSQGRRFPDSLDRPAREARRRMAWVIEHQLPERAGRPSDAADLDALAQALTCCDLVTCDAFMADVVKRTRLDRRHDVELFSGRRRDVTRLGDRVQDLIAGHNQP